jgi:hypothetical protein
MDSDEGVTLTQNNRKEHRAISKAGRRGPTGQPGKDGQKGATGLRGPAGAQGPQGPPIPRGDILAVVEDQFSEIRKQLDIQLERTVQLQQQIDTHFKCTQDVQDQLGSVHTLVRNLVEQSE